MKPQEALARIIEHPLGSYTIRCCRSCGRSCEKLSPTLISAIITGLRVKKETIGEIATAAQVMREFATPVDVPDDRQLVDTCGFGGDSAHTFNISTTAAFVVAAARARVAETWWPAPVSSKSGSADVLEALGVNLNRTPLEIAENIRETGLGFHVCA